MLVLVVDDNRDVADSTGLVLTLQGLDVLIRYDGPSALDAVFRYSPACIVLDIRMPKMDGYAVAQRVRAQTSTSKIVAYSGENTLRPDSSALFDERFSKPDIGSLLGYIANLQRDVGGAGIDREECISSEGRGSRADGDDSSRSA